MKVLRKTSCNTEISKSTKDFSFGTACFLCNESSIDCQCKKTSCQCGNLDENCQWPMCICDNCLEMICRCENEQ
jgi:hypothetical protein